jgi:hypothetical protein
MEYAVARVLQHLREQHGGMFRQPRRAAVVGEEGLTANASEVGAYLCGLLEEFAHRLVASFAPASSRVITVGAVHLSGTELLSAALIGGYRLTRQFVTQGGRIGKPVRIWRGPATVTGEPSPVTVQEHGKAGKGGDPQPGDRLTRRGTAFGQGG